MYGCSWLNDDTNQDFIFSIKMSYFQALYEYPPPNKELTI